MLSSLAFYCIYLFKFQEILIVVQYKNIKFYKEYLYKEIYNSPILHSSRARENVNINASTHNNTNKEREECCMKEAEKEVEEEDEAEIEPEENEEQIISRKEAEDEKKRR